MNHDKFSSEVELGSFLGSSDIIPNAYDAILKTGSTHYKHYTNLSGCNVLAFGFSADGTKRFLHGKANDLVSSKDHNVVDFIATKVNPSFSINRTAFGLFKSLFDESLFDEISKLKDQLDFEPLIITGQALGGYVAILFALWLQSIVDEKESSSSKNTKRPICITFGSPLVGDDAFQRAILERPRWKSCFLNVVSNTDPIPRLLLASKYAYKPFGTYLFCSKSGGYGFFEDHDSILGVLDAMASSNMELNDYGDVLRALKKKALYRGVSKLGEFNFNPLRAGITLQLIEVGVLNPQEENSTNALVAKMEAEQARLIRSKRNVYEPTKKLNDMKISLTCMEWYMKLGRSKGGYYKAYKNPKTIKERERQQEIVKHKRMLTQYWRTFVVEKGRMPQKEGAKLRTRWLLGGTNYRRIVEPLDIAEHYEKGESNYIAKRSEHYELLEKWLDEDKKDKDPSKTRNKAVSLIEDSCFWARVEEAFIWLGKLKDVDIDVNGYADELVKFERYVMESVSEYAVSPEIFLEGSSFMEWWGEYKAYKGNVYDSSLAQYMNKGSYNSYE